MDVRKKALISITGFPSTISCPLLLSLDFEIFSSSVSWKVEGLFYVLLRRFSSQQGKGDSEDFDLTFACLNKVSAWVVVDGASHFQEDAAYLGVLVLRFVQCIYYNFQPVPPVPWGPDLCLQRLQQPPQIMSRVMLPLEPLEIQSRLHPPHPLIFDFKERFRGVSLRIEYHCSCCQKMSRQPLYRCEECDLILNLDCAFLRIPIISSFSWRRWNSQNLPSVWRGRFWWH
ncbi:hypothetical protein CRG98_039360 [Punica granatum]|uniref:DC1 domain-containing protein n=1 Tax=Punica granatum TaxID=22663 RepID=A0A2I0I8E2_PUNGR|nr:hypothetical protein CRG98_039360 [Punica granatum]